MQVEKLKTVDADTLLSTPMKKTMFIVDTLIPQGVNVLSGASKIGKSWLMLWLGLQVAQGLPVWGLKTKQCDVLYLCLEDTQRRIKDHPFKIQNNEEMQRMIESIRKVGAITPALARPLPEGDYELISGHRRLVACQVLGLETMPVIVREMSDDEAIIAMVDANLQREHVFPSEKAFAYKMKLDAIKHQGVTSSQVGKKLLSIEKVGEDSGESRNQVHRYIRLTYLIPELLAMVDDGKIAFNPAVELSYLTRTEQGVLLDAMSLNDCTPSHAQAIRLKKLSQEGVLVDKTIYDVLSEEKPNQQEQYKFKREDVRKYFPKSYTDKQVCDTIIKLLEQWQRKRERDRDAQ